MPKKPSPEGLVASRVKALRGELGLSQEELSALSGGLDRREISAVERGINKLRSYEVRAKLARAFDVSLDELAAYVDGRMDLKAAARLSKERSAARFASASSPSGAVP